MSKHLPTLKKQLEDQLEKSKVTWNDFTLDVNHKRRGKIGKRGVFSRIISALSFSSEQDDLGMVGDQNEDDKQVEKKLTMAMAPYLSLSNLLNGIKILSRDVFGIELREIPKEEWIDESNECWIISSKTLQKSPKIIKFDVYKEEDGSFIGFIYIFEILLFFGE